MTVLDERQLVEWFEEWPRPTRHAGPTRNAGGAPVRTRSLRPAPARPPVAPLRYRGTGIAMSRAPHTRRPVSTAVTVSLAGLAALVTLWLGALANFSGDSSAAPVSAPDQLAVVQVQAGETLQQLAQRVAPGASAAQTVDRIRDLNKLDSAAIDAGQTLIAPLG
jgi:LysM repeat protein